MGRNFAGILGSLAFFTVVIRGLSHRGGVESTLFSAAIYLFLYAFIGFILGEFSGWIVLDSVRAKVSAELDAKSANSQSAGATKT